LALLTVDYASGLLAEHCHHYDIPFARFFSSFQLQLQPSWLALSNPHVTCPQNYTTLRRFTFFTFETGFGLRGKLQ
jgi:hypothetical protein